MGRDKALLPVPGSDLLLWQRQLGILEELRPREIFWSGPVRPGLPEHIRVVFDAVENGGPLAGISACLNALQGDLLVVLAVDLPRMSASFLENLLARCSAGCGVVCRHGDYFEPLAALYPKELHVLAAEHLRQGRLAMQDLVREAVQRKFLEVMSPGEGDLPLFKNLNAPDDLQNCF
jgi:molybdenum cofactor guanylyltransferase